MSKIAIIPGCQANPRAILHSILETDDVEAVVCVVRRAGAWAVTYGGAITAGGLSMAAVKLMFDVMRENESDETNGLLRDGA